MRDYGNDATIMVTGILLKKAIDAGDELNKRGVHVKVIEIPTLKPMNEDVVLESAGKTGAIVTVEDHNIIGGLGSAVAEILSEKMPTPMKRIGVLDSYNQSGDPESLYADNKMTPFDIADAVQAVCAMKK